MCYKIRVTTGIARALLAKELKSVASMLLTLSSLDKVGLCPANDMTLSVLRYLEDMSPGAAELVKVFDRDSDKYYPFSIDSYENILSMDLKNIYVLSSNYAQAIISDIGGLGVSHEVLVDLKGEFTLPISVDLNELVENWPKDYLVDDSNKLFEIIGDESVIIFISPYWYDIYEKISLLNQNLKTKVIWVENYSPPFVEEKTGIVKSDFLSVMNYALKRDDREKIQFCIVHGISYSINALLKKLIPDIRIVSYIYDWLEHSIPFKYRHELATQTESQLECIESEYVAAEGVLNGDLADHIIYKDYGEKFALYAGINATFIPSSLVRKTFLSNVSRTAKGKLLFIGTLFHDNFHSKKINGHSFFISVFRRIAETGLSLDVYYSSLRTSTKIINKYKEENLKLKLNYIAGESLDILIPQLANRYSWGILIAANEFEISKQHAMYTLPSRVFAYAALGLPIIVSTDFGAVAEIVEKFKIGIVIDRDEIACLPEQINNSDYIGFVNNVKIFREQYCLDQYIDRMVEVFSGENSRV